MPSRSSSICATHGSVKTSSSSKSAKAKRNPAQRNPKSSSSSDTAANITTALPSASASTTLFSFNKSADIPSHMDYSLDRFNSDVESSHPEYQYNSSDKSMPTYKGRMTSVLDEFDAAYQKK